MKVDGLGQYNPQTSIQASKDASQDSSFEAALKQAYSEGDKAKLKEACSQFERMMLKNLYQQMKATVPKDDFLGDSNAQEIFQDMMDDELMNRSSHRGMGIAEMIYRQLSAQMDRSFKVDGTTSGQNTDSKITPSLNIDSKVPSGKETDDQITAETPDGVETADKKGLQP